MIEATPETLREILANRGANTPPINAPVPNTPNNTPASALMPKIDNAPASINLNAGTNFIKDLTDLVKSATDFLNTDLGKMFLNKLQAKQDASKQIDELTALMQAPYGTEQPTQAPAPQAQAQPKPKQEEQKKMETDENKQYEAYATQIMQFTKQLIETLVKQKSNITGAEILKELNEKEADTIKTLSKVLKQNDKTQN